MEEQLINSMVAWIKEALGSVTGFIVALYVATDLVTRAWKSLDHARTAVVLGAGFGIAGWFGGYFGEKGWYEAFLLSWVAVWASGKLHDHIGSQFTKAAENVVSKTITKVKGLK